MQFTKCPLSIEELEQYRDEEGFIDLDKTNLDIDESSRNQLGAVDIFKYWIDFNGTKVLLKEEKTLNGEPNFTIYSELIMSELAKQMGVPAAKCDLIKFRGKRGIISHLAFEYGKETLEMTDAIIGQTNEYSDAPDCFDYVEVEERLESALKEEIGLSNEEITEVMNERRKQKVLQLFSCEADNHIQNEGFIIWRDESGKTHMKVAPMFDNEHSFALQYARSDLEGDVARVQKEKKMAKLLEEAYSVIECEGEKTPIYIQNLIKQFLVSIKDFSPQVIEEILNVKHSLRSRIIGQGKIVCLAADEQYDSSLRVDNTFAYILDSAADDVIGDFCAELMENLDIEKIIRNIESRIKASIPDVAKEILREFVKMRRADFEQVIYGEEISDVKRKAQTLSRASKVMTFKANSNRQDVSIKNESSIRKKRGDIEK